MVEISHNQDFLHEKLISLLSVSVVLLAACGKQQNEPQNGKDSAQLQTVVIASTGSDADIWRYIATLPETKAAGLKLEVKTSLIMLQ